MRSINLDQLRTFLAVVGAGSFSAAARNLHLSQPAVSVQVRELERYFGVQLIERFGKQAFATQPGRDLMQIAEQIFRTCDEAHVSMRRYRENWTGRVRISTTITAQVYLLPAVLRQLSREQPGVDLHVRNLPTEESIAAIIKNETDLAIVTMPFDKNDQLKVEPLVTENLVAIHPAGARNLPKVVTPEYVLRQDLLLEHVNAGVHKLVMQWLSGFGEAPRARMHLGTIEAIKSAVASELGMSIVPEMATSRSDTDIVVRPLNPPLIRSLALIEHRSKPNEPAIEIVRNALLGLRGKRPAAPSTRSAGNPVVNRRARPQRAQ